jgi:hypothetical protein
MRVRATDLWRLLQGCAASVLIASAIYMAEQPYPYHGCEICKANLPAWMCFLECLFG